MIHNDSAIMKNGGIVSYPWQECFYRPDGAGGCHNKKDVPVAQLIDNGFRTGGYAFVIF